MRIAISKQLAGCMALIVTMILVFSGVCTQRWLTGKVPDSGTRDPTNPIVEPETEYFVGLLRTRADRLVPGSPTTTNTYDNQGDRLEAGETALATCLVGLVATMIACGTSALLAVGRMSLMGKLGHTITIYGSFIGGIAFIVASIAYSAMIEKNEFLAFSTSFIMVLISGFITLIAGLTFVLSKQELYSLNDAMFF